MFLIFAVIVIGLRSLRTNAQRNRLQLWTSAYWKTHWTDELRVPRWFAHFCHYRANDEWTGLWHFYGRLSFHGWKTTFPLDLPWQFDCGISTHFKQTSNATQPPLNWFLCAVNKFPLLIRFCSVPQICHTNVLVYYSKIKFNKSNKDISFPLTRSLKIFTFPC